MTFASSLLYAKKVFFSKTNRGSEKSSGRRSLTGAIICIAVSLIPLVAVLSVSSGMISGITGRMIHLSTQDVQVTLDKESIYAKSENEMLNLASSLCSADGAVAAYSEVNLMALAAGSSFRSGASVRAVEKDIFEKNKYFSSFFNIVEGDIDLSKERNAVIGKKLSEILGLHTGDNLKLITLRKAAGKTVPKVSVFKVTGIVSCGYQELDALWVFVPLENAFNAFKNSSMEYYVSIETDRTFSEKLEKTLLELKKMLLSDYNSGRFSIDTWKNINAAQFENFASTRALLIVIMFAIILAASINISAAIVMVVMERKKEIAILKSTGASSSGIALSFVMTGLFTGLSGILIGIPAGLLISVFINPLINAVEHIVNFFLGLFNAGHIKFLDPAFYLQQIPVVIPWNEICLIAVSVIVLSIVMSVLPSIRAGKSNITEVLSKN